MIDALRAPRTDDRLLWKPIFANIAYAALLVAHDLELFRVLAEGPLTADEVAQALKIARRPADVLLTTCVSQGLLEARQGRYALTPTAEDYLLERSPTYFGAFLDAMIANDSVFSFDAMKRAVLADAPQVYSGQALFESHAEQLALAHAFTHAMHGHSIGPALVWPDKVDLSRAKVLLDVGGGSGAHALGALRRWPHLRALVLDIPAVCPLADDYAARFGLERRLTAVAADMWNDPFPAADVHFYADIFHDWPDDKCRLLGDKSFQSLPSGGRIIVHELLYRADKTGPFAAAAYSGAMLLWTEGRQRSGQEITSLLERAGFTDLAVQPTVGFWSVVVGQKP